MADPIRPVARLTPAAPTRPEARPDRAAEVAASDRVRPEARPAADVPVEVADTATLEGALPLDRTALIGLFSGPEGRSALLRLGTGAVVRAAPGDVIGGAVVTAIAEDRLRLWRDGRETVLTMPA